MRGTCVCPSYDSISLSSPGLVVGGYRGGGGRRLLRLDCGYLCTIVPGGMGSSFQMTFSSSSFYCSFCFFLGICDAMCWIKVSRSVEVRNIILCGAWNQWHCFIYIRTSPSVNNLWHFYIHGIISIDACISHGLQKYNATTQNWRFRAELLLEDPSTLESHDTPHVVYKI